MADESFTQANGAAATADGEALPTGYQPEKDETVTQTQTHGGEDGGDKEDGGLDDTTIKVMQQEIQGLRRDRSELQVQLQEARAEMERYEVEKKATKFDASYLEGELARAQHGLTSKSSVAEAAEAEALGLQRLVKDLEADKASLVASNAELESQVRGLMEGMAAYAAVEADLAAEREKATAVDSQRQREISTLELKGKKLEEQLRLLREEKEMMEAELKMRASQVVEMEAELKMKASQEVEMEKTVKELTEKISELEGKVNGFRSNNDINPVADHKEKDVDVTTANCLTVSWATAGLAAASTASVAAAITAIYLRHARQR